MNEDMRALETAIEDTLTAAGLWRENATLLAAVSGGADSVALLHALCRVAPRVGLRVTACHVQHGLRGESSKADERFVRALCDGLRVPLMVERARLVGGLDDAGAETRAREERRRIFAAQLRACSADALLTAHHRDDQAETALMRLARGAGASGLCGIRRIAPFGDGLVLRPFLDAPKRLLIAALQNEGLPYREDESNQSLCTPRNALRLDVLPRLEKLFCGASAHIASAAEALQVDEDCLDALANELYDRAFYAEPPIFALRKQALSAAPEALRRRALRRWYAQSLALRGLRPDERGLGHADTLRLSALAAAPYGARLNLPCDTEAFAGQSCLHLTKQGGAPLAPFTPPPPVAVTPEVAEYRYGGVALRLSPCAPDAPPPLSARTVWLTAELMRKGLYLGAPMDGDTIRPLGARGAKPLRRFLTDRKLDPPFRLCLPELAIGNDVLWIPALCTAETLRACAPPNGAYQMTLVGEAPYAFSTD